MIKAPTSTEMSKEQSDNTKNATKSSTKTNMFSGYKKGKEYLDKNAW